MGNKLSEPAAAAAAIPGAGVDRVAQLRSAFCFASTLSLNSCVRRLGPLVAARGALQQLSVILRAISALPVERLTGVLMSPLFQASVQRLMRLMQSELPDDGENTRNDALAREASVLCLTLPSEVWFELEAVVHAPVTLEPGSSVLLPGSKWKLVVTSPCRLTVKVAYEAEAMTLIKWGEDVVLARVPRSALASVEQADGIVTVPDAFNLRERLFLTDLRIEQFTTSEFAAFIQTHPACGPDSELSPREVECELKKAIDVLQAVWPDAVHDVVCCCSGLVAISSPPGRFHSRTNTDLPFVIEVTVRRDSWPFVIAEALIHEISHLKLDMATCIEPLIQDDDRHIYRHPWRPDLRPINGVLFGAHAFLAVLKMYEHALSADPSDDRARREYALRHGEVGQAMDLLRSNADFTDAGLKVFLEMENAYRAAPFPV